MDLYHIFADKKVWEEVYFNSGDGHAVVLLTGSLKRAKEIGDNLSNIRVLQGQREEQSAISGSYKDAGIIAISGGMGPSSTDIIVRELIDSGAKRILRVGTCGAQQDYIEIGDICAATSAIPDEDVSQKYVEQRRATLWNLAEMQDTLSFDPEYPSAHPDTVKAVQLAAKAINFSRRVYTGLYHTKSTLERELQRGPEGHRHEEYMRLMKMRGVIASEMEASVLFTLAEVLVQETDERRFHNRVLTKNRDAEDEHEVQAGALCVAVGGYDPEKKIIVPYGIPEQIREAEETIVKFSLEAAVQWNRIDREKIR